MLGFLAHGMCSAKHLTFCFPLHSLSSTMAETLLQEVAQFTRTGAQRWTFGGLIAIQFFLATFSLTLLTTRQHCSLWKYLWVRSSHCFQTQPTQVSLAQSYRYPLRSNHYLVTCPQGLFWTWKIAFLSSNVPAGAFLNLKNSISEQQHAPRGFFVPQKMHFWAVTCPQGLFRTSKI